MQYEQCKFNNEKDNDKREVQQKQQNNYWIITL